MCLKLIEVLHKRGQGSFSGKPSRCHSNRKTCSDALLPTSIPVPTRMALRSVPYSGDLSVQPPGKSRNSQELETYPGPDIAGPSYSRESVRSPSGWRHRELGHSHCRRKCSPASVEM